MKALSKTTEMVIVSLIILALIGLVWLIYWRTVLDIKVENEANTNERRAINLANVLTSYKDLAYADNTGRVYRGLLEEKKIEKMMGGPVKTYDEIKDHIIYSNDLGYSDAKQIVCIEDMQTKKIWCSILIRNAPGVPPLEKVKGFFSCVFESFRAYPIASLDLLSLLPKSSKPLEEIASCVEKEFNLKVNPQSIFVSAGSASSIGIPVDIFSDGEIHTGRLMLTVVKW